MFIKDIFIYNKYWFVISLDLINEKLKFRNRKKYSNIHIMLDFGNFVHFPNSFFYLGRTI
jgi:hypothetical protein